MSDELAPIMSLAVGAYPGEEMTEMFHGTDSRAAQMIVISQHFRPSKCGLLGEGVYVTRSRQKAEGYRVHHPNATQPQNLPLPGGADDPGCVLKFRVRLGACKIITKDMSQAERTSWHDDTVQNPDRAMLLAAGGGEPAPCGDSALLWRQRPLETTIILWEWEDGAAAICHEHSTPGLFR